MPIRVTVGGHSAVLLGRDIIVGRGEACEIRIDDASLSRIHASFGTEDGRVRVTDLASSNGTSVNGELLVGSRFVGLRDRIEVGDLTVTLDEVDAEGVTQRTAWDTLMEDVGDQDDGPTKLRPSFRIR